MADDLDTAVAAVRTREANAAAMATVVNVLGRALVSVSATTVDVEALRDVAGELEVYANALAPRADVGTTDDIVVEACEVLVVGENFARCHAVTRTGAPCRGRPVAGSDYCSVHAA